MAMSPLALQACQACGTSLADVPVTQTENAPWHWHRCCCRCKWLPANIIWLYMIHRWCQSARLVSSGLSNCAEVMMGFIFGVERTLKLPLMISLRRPDRTRWIQDGPFVGDTLRLKLRLLRGWGYLRYIEIYLRYSRHLGPLISYSHMASYGFIWPFPILSILSFPGKLTTSLSLMTCLPCIMAEWRPARLLILSAAKS